MAFIGGPDSAPEAASEEGASARIFTYYQREWWPAYKALISRNSMWSTIVLALGVEFTPGALLPSDNALRTYKSGIEMNSLHRFVSRPPPPAAGLPTSQRRHPTTVHTTFPIAACNENGRSRHLDPGLRTPSFPWGAHAEQPRGRYAHGKGSAKNKDSNHSHRSQ